MAANARIKPIRYIKSTVRSYRNIRRTKLKTGFLVSSAGLREIGSIENIRSVRSKKVESLESEACLRWFWFVSKNNIPGWFTAQQKTIVLLSKRIAFVKNNARWSAATINVARRDCSRVALAPLGLSRQLVRSLLGTPRALPVERRESEIAIFHEPGRTGCWRVIVVVMEYVAVRSDRLLVRVAEIVSDDGKTCTVRVHAHCGAANVLMSVAAWLSAFDAAVVGTSSKEVQTGGLNVRVARIAGIEIVLPIGPHRDGVKTVVMILAFEPGKENLLDIAIIETVVPVDVRDRNQMRRLGNEDFVINHSHAERSD